jgi:sarcosine oxidase subunit gamma
MTISGSKHSQFVGIDLDASFKGIAGDYGVWFNEISVTEFVNLRGDSTHSGFLTGVQRVTGVELPVFPNTVVRSGGLSCHWLGPDEWLMTVNKPAVSIIQDLEDSLSGLHIAVTDLTGGQSLLGVGGRQSRDVLSAACTLDLHADAFAQGSCAQTILAHSNVLITPAFQSSGDCVFEVLVRRSYADHLIRWLMDAAHEDGFEFRLDDDSGVD